MIFTPTTLPGAFVIEPEQYADERGFFARTWCVEEFAARGLCTQLVQSSISFNHRRATLRGMHYQVAPYAEVKLVRCTAGVVYDVIIDVRPDSPTFKQHFGIELSAQNYRTLYVPHGCAHGFLTLADNSEVLYHMSETYKPEAGRGVRWNDPAFNIVWPDSPRIMHERDRSYPNFIS
jgi:dTDP-4-dehydrorhamnose 3,5-epimerase